MRGLHHPDKAAHIHKDLKEHTLEHHISNGAGQGCLMPRVAQTNILRAHHGLYKFIGGKAAVQAVKGHAAKAHHIIPYHHSVHYIGLSDKIRYKGVYRLVINILRGADLLNFALIHHHHRVAHRQRFLLVVGHIDKGNAQPLLNGLQLLLHILSQL